MDCSTYMRALDTYINENSQLLRQGMRAPADMRQHKTSDCVVVIEDPSIEVQPWIPGMLVQSAPRTVYQIYLDKPFMTAVRIPPDTRELPANLLNKIGDEFIKKLDQHIPAKDNYYVAAGVGRMELHTCMESFDYELRILYLIGMHTLSHTNRIIEVGGKLFAPVSTPVSRYKRAVCL